jgi:hypothetical protein
MENVKRQSEEEIDFGRLHNALKRRGLEELYDEHMLAGGTISEFCDQHGVEFVKEEVSGGASYNRCDHEAFEEMMQRRRQEIKERYERAQRGKKKVL